jgi:hypothetical protein
VPEFTERSSSMVSNVVSFPRELTHRAQVLDWRSLGDVTDCVLGRVAVRCGIASSVPVIAHEERGRRLVKSRLAASAE